MRRTVMLKIKYRVASFLSSCLIIGNFSACASELTNTNVFLTGNGIATRLHSPVLKQFSNIDTSFIRLPEENELSSEIKVQPTDWLFLGTPVYKHKQHLLYAIKKYKNILCEKPVGLSLEEIDQIDKAINENQTLFIVNYALRFLPQIQQIKEFINGNEIKSVKLICNSNFNKNPPNKIWKSDYTLGGGVMYSILPHLIDLLNFTMGENDLSTVTFESSSEIPMDDIKVSSKTLNKTDISINVNLRENFDELKLEVQTPEKTKVFDLVSSSTNIIDKTKYPNGTLSATSECSPWRISFRYLLENIFLDPTNPNFAKIQDAKNVHKVLKVINSKINPVK